MSPAELNPTSSGMEAKHFCLKLRLGFFSQNVEGKKKEWFILTGTDCQKKKNRRASNPLTILTKGHPIHGLALVL